MKVAVSALIPNPFRNMKKYPIDEDKVKRLMQSMTDTTFWDNILARKADEQFQIAYGHHRLLALRKVMRDGEVDIPVRKLTDEQMLKIMANENGEEWGGNTQADLETIRTVREYLVEHPDVIHRVDILKSTGKDKGPGAVAISSFLGGIWTENKVRAVLEVIVPVEKGEVDEEAVRRIPTTSEARKFVAEARTMPVAAQRRLAERIASHEVQREAIKSAAHTERFPKPAQRREAALEERLREIGRLADTLKGRIVSELFPFKDLLRSRARQAYPDLASLHNLRLILDQLFTISEGDSHGKRKQSGQNRKALAN